MEELLESIDISTTEGLEKRLLIEMFYSTGCRVSEMINVKISDIDFTNKTIRIMGKGSKERIVYFGDYASKYLDNYLSKVKCDKYLFTNKKGEKLTINEVEQIVKDIMKHISIKTHDNRFRYDGDALHQIADKLCTFDRVFSCIFQ